jgi:defect-in-organelle-trafficking protein DotD
MHRLTIFCLPIFLSCLTGCTALKTSTSQPDHEYPPKNTPSSEISETETDPIEAGSVEAQLIATAKSIDKSLNTLASAQEAESPPILTTTQLITPEGGMGNTANIDWAGPIGPLIDKIARMTDYRVKTLGHEPAIPIIITITAKRAVVAEILQNASFQAGRRAHIIVSPKTRVIELRYLS